MYRPPEDLRELRKQGKPWLAAAILLVMLIISGSLIYLILESRTDNWKPPMFRKPAEDNSEEYDTLEDTIPEPPADISPIVGHVDTVPSTVNNMSTTTTTTTLPVTSTTTIPSLTTTTRPLMTTTHLTMTSSSTASSSSSTTTTTSSTTTTTTPPPTTTPPSTTSTTPPPLATTTPLPTKFSFDSLEEKPVITFQKAAMTSLSEVCSRIGKSILQRRGNAVEAAIATDICIGATQPHLTGLGGGAMMIISQSNSTPKVINGLTTSPRSATELTYMNPDLAKKGYASIACPGTLATYWTAFKKFGSSKLSWQDLLLPTIDLLERGFTVSASLAQSILDFSEELSIDKPLRAMFSNIQEGELMMNVPLAQTFRRLASSRDAYQLFYRGDMANQIVQEMRTKGALLTKLDFVNYEAKVEEAMGTVLGDGSTLYGPMPPSIFSSISMVPAILSKLPNSTVTSERYYLNLLELLTISRKYIKDIADPTFSIESRLLAMNLTSSDYHDDVIRSLFTPSTGLFYPKQQQQSLSTTSIETSGDELGSHVNVIDADGMAVSLSSSLNSRFGSFRFSEKLGFVWNNYMSAFSFDSSDDSGTNSVEGSKRPRTFMSPMIIINQSMTSSVLGTSGAKFVEQTISQITSSLLLSNLSQSFSLPRIFISGDQLFTNDIRVKDLLPTSLNIQLMTSSPPIAHVLQLIDNSIHSLCDTHICANDGY